jgi:cell wall-associated NlpC family hydrolase
MDSKQVLYDLALRLYGLPYLWAGDDPIKGFDCSGLVLELMQSVGQLPPKIDINAQGIFDTFKARGRETTVADFGSLLFFGVSKLKITHVTFALNRSLMLEAGGGGSSTLTAAIAADQNAYNRVRPITNRKDLVGIVTPDYQWEA